MKKQHAEHNEKACTFLFANGNFPDWVVTTAFYSALHFVQHEIFPKKIGSVDYRSFEHYYQAYFHNAKNKPTKHKETINLVYEYLGEDAGDIYKWLHDTCRTARYRNFSTDPAVSEKAKNRLSELKEFCFK